MDINEIVGVKFPKQDEMIAKEAYKRGVEFEKLSDKKIRMSYGEKSYTAKNGKIRNSPNAPLTARIVAMKDVTSRILRSRGFNAPENTVFDHQDADRAWYWASTILPVVLKPARGNLGKLVFVNINNYDEFKKCFKKVAKKHKDVLVEKFVVGSEHRFTYINNEIVTVNRNIPANVLGDGKHTINELVSLKNIEKGKSTVYKEIKINKESERILSQQGYNVESIPKKNAIVFVRKTSNIATGGEAIDVTDDISLEIKEEVREAINTIKGLFLCGADVLISNNEAYILEINTYPGLLTDDYLERGKYRNVIKKLVDEMFPETVESK